MKISVISTGSELLKGTTVNTNLAFLGQALTAAGFTPERGAIVPDSGKSMAEALASLVPVSDIIITTGGLGPTSDDITRQVVCEFFGLKLKEDPQLRKKLEEYWQYLKRGHAPDALFLQAQAPENAVVLENRNGTAPGLRLAVVVFAPELHHQLAPHRFGRGRLRGQLWRQGPESAR